MEIMLVYALLFPAVLSLHFILFSNLTQFKRTKMLQISLLLVTWGHISCDEEVSSTQWPDLFQEWGVSGTSTGVAASGQ